MQAVAEAMDVEEREGEQESIGAGDLPTGSEVHRVGGEIIVREHRAFGSAGGSGGVDDAGGSVAIEVHRRAFVRDCGGFAREIRGGPDGDGAGAFGGGDESDWIGGA